MSTPNHDHDTVEAVAQAIIDGGYNPATADSIAIIALDTLRELGYTRADPPAGVL